MTARKGGFLVVVVVIVIVFVFSGFRKAVDDDHANRCPAAPPVTTALSVFVPNDQ
jgi:hypothetical protein